jgi:hypothetical protein
MYSDDVKFSTANVQHLGKTTTKLINIKTDSLQITHTTIPLFRKSLCSSFDKSVLCHIDAPLAIPLKPRIY